MLRSGREFRPGQARLANTTISAPADGLRHSRKEPRKPPMSNSPTLNSIAVLGAGALGGYYGGRLAQHGHDVHMLLRSDYEHVRQRGLRVHSVSGDFTLQPAQLRVYNDAAMMPKVDLVIVALK